MRVPKDLFNDNGTESYFRGNVKFYKLPSKFSYLVNLQKASDGLPKIDNC